MEAAAGGAGGVQGVWRALADIPEGRAVSVSYLGVEELRLPRAERRRALLERYGFPCRCDRCELEVAGGPSPEDLEQDATAALATLRRFHDPATPDRAPALRAAREALRCMAGHAPDALRAWLIIGLILIMICYIC